MAKPISPPSTAMEVFEILSVLQGMENQNPSPPLNIRVQEAIAKRFRLKKRPSRLEAVKLKRCFALIAGIEKVYPEDEEFCKELKEEHTEYKENLLERQLNYIATGRYPRHKHVVATFHEQRRQLFYFLEDYKFPFKKSLAKRNSWYKKRGKKLLAKLAESPCWCNYRLSIREEDIPFLDVFENQRDVHLNVLAYLHKSTPLEVEKLLNSKRFSCAYLAYTPTF